MKKVVLGITMVVCLMFPGANVLAAGLNANESAVIGTARGEFQMDGVTYKAKESYVNQLVQYLSQDGVDLNGEQSQQIVSKMFGNVSKGVTEGYLVPVDKPTDSQNTSPSKKPVESEKPAESEKNPQQVTEEIVDPIIKEQEKKGNKKEIKEIDEKDHTTVVDRKAGEVLVTNQEKQTVLRVNTVIKNTGFEVNQTIILGVGMAMFMLLCTGVTMKFKFFAQQQDE